MNASDDTAAPAAPDTTSAGSTAGRIVLYLLAGAACGWGSFELLERYRDYFTLTAEFEELAAAIQPTDEQSQKLRTAVDARDIRNCALCLALTGSLLAGVLGALSGLIVHSFPRALAGLVAGVALGGLFGALAGWGGYLFFGQFEKSYVPGFTDPNYDLWRSANAALTHGIYWISIGAAVAAATLASGGKRMFGRVLTAAVGTGIVWAMCYPFAAAILFQNVTAEVRLPDGRWNALFWIGTFSLLLCLATGRAACRAAKPAAISAQAGSNA